MWSLREPLSLKGRMSRAEDSLVLENNSGHRYGVWRGRGGGGGGGGRDLLFTVYYGL